MKFAYPTDPASLPAWASRLIDQLNRVQFIEDYPVAADDTAAAAVNVPIGGGYVTASGAVRRRVA